MNQRIFNNQAHKDIRRKLRKAQTPEERKLWNLVRNKKIDGYKFFRQYSVGNYILDFYCPEKKLALEADGGQHSRDKNIKYDQERTQYLNTKNIKVIRFWNNEILNNIEGVYLSILDALKS